MRRFRFWIAALGASLCFSMQAEPAPAQTQSTAGGAVQPARYVPSNDSVRRRNPGLSFFGDPRGGLPRQSLRPAAALPPAPIQMGRVGKPFSGMQQSGGVSPYLALETRESGVSLPNYYLFVKPQLDQQAYNQSQQAELIRMQRQIRNASAGGAIVAGPGGVPTTGHSTQFMNNGGYYPAKR